LVEGLMNIILGIREQYRQARDWEQADVLREQLKELGIAVEDRPEEPTWRVEHGEEPEGG
jgi:cysteinyl-tRNA synthetase